MVNVTQRTARRDGVTFAYVIVENDASDRRRIRLEFAVDGAVWPPRRAGVPEAGWGEASVTVTVAAGGRRGVGFATPATVDGDVVEVASVSARVSDPAADLEPTADGVVRALGEFAPPLAATPREGEDCDAPIPREDANGTVPAREQRERAGGTEES